MAEFENVVVNGTAKQLQKLLDGDMYINQRMNGYGIEKAGFLTLSSPAGDSYEDVVLLEPLLSVKDENGRANFGIVELSATPSRVPVLVKGVCQGIEENDAVNLGQVLKLVQNSGSEKTKYVIIEQQENGKYKASVTFDEILKGIKNGIVYIAVYDDIMLNMIGYSSENVAFERTHSSLQTIVSIHSDNVVDLQSEIIDLGQYSNDVFPEKNRYVKFGDLQESEIFERTQNRVNVIDQNSDDDHYPTAKAVYAAIETIAAPRDETPEKYFDITADGVVSLKAEYRGTGGRTNGVDHPYSISDNGYGKNGSQNSELPESIVIPNVIDGTAVSGFQPYMFESNLRVKVITIPSHITALSEGFCNKALNLEVLNGTENIETLGNTAFQKTSLKKAEFPKLKTLSGNAHFNMCAYLEYVDIGNVSALSPACFQRCENLVTVQGGESVKSIPQQCFMLTGRLKNVSFLKNVTSVGTLGMFRSGLRHNWHKHYGCDFGDFATPAQWISTDTWAGCTYTPCCTALRSTFNQEDDSWWDLTGFTDAQKQWLTQGNCVPTAAAMLYSAITGEELTSPVDFIRKLLSTGVKLDSDLSYVSDWFAALGFTPLLMQYKKSDIQILYNELLKGSLAIMRCLGNASASKLPTNNSHAVLVHGITENGELMICDSISDTEVFGKPTAQTYTIPIQNLVMDDAIGNDFLIIRRKTEAREG